MPGLEDAELVSIVGLIYDAVIAPDQWQVALDAIRRHFGFRLGALAVIGLPKGNAIVRASTNIPEDFAEALAAYNEEVVAIWGGAARMAELPLEEPVLNSQVTSREIWEQNAFFNTWAQPLGLVDQVGIILARDRTMMATIGLGLHESKPTLDEHQMQQLRLLSPHLRRAATISRLLDDAASKATTFEMALDAAASGVILVDADLGIVHANGSGEMMLREGDPIRNAAGALTLRHELVPGQLRNAVGIASRAEAQLERRGIGIPTRLRDGSPLSIHVMPLRQRPHRTGRPLRATAAVFIAESGAPPDLPPDAMSLLYGLTPAEMRVFELIVDGRSTEEIAQQLGVAPSTLRTHLLHVFEKTGRHSRADLVKLSSEITLPG